MQTGNRHLPGCYCHHQRCRGTRTKALYAARNQLDLLGAVLARIAGVGLETVYRNLLDTGMITQLILGHCPLPFFFKGAGQWPCALSQWDEKYHLMADFGNHRIAVMTPRDVKRFKSIGSFFV